MIKKTDQQLKEDILEELRWAPNVSDTDIGVTVHDGVVTLTGSVPNFAEKYSAEKAALRIVGVSSVAEKIEVKIPGTYMRDDTEIAKNVVKALKRNVSLPDNLKVMVEHGCVTLQGEVSSGYQRNLAFKIIRYIKGVKEIKNDIAIKPSVRPQDVKRNIKKVLRKIAEEDADSVDVEAEGSKIILRGKVRSLPELEDIKWAALAAPGVSEVDDRMSVSW